MSFHLLQLSVLVPVSLTGLCIGVGLAIGAVVGADLPRPDRFGL